MLEDNNHSEGPTTGEAPAQRRPNTRARRTAATPAAGVTGPDAAGVTGPDAVGAVEVDRTLEPVQTAAPRTSRRRAVTKVAAEVSASAGAERAEPPADRLSGSLRTGDAVPVNAAPVAGLSQMAPADQDLSQAAAPASGSARSATKRPSRAPRTTASKAAPVDGQTLVAPPAAQIGLTLEAGPATPAGDSAGSTPPLAPPMVQASPDASIGVSSDTAVHPEGYDNHEHNASFAPKGRSRRTPARSRRSAASPQAGTSAGLAEPGESANAGDSLDAMAASITGAAFGDHGSADREAGDHGPANREVPDRVSSDRQRGGRGSATRAPEDRTTADRDSAEADPIGQALTALGRTVAATAATSSDEAPLDQAPAEADPIGQALTALGRQTRSRRRQAPTASDDDDIHPNDVLDDIVSAITGEDLDTATTDDVEERDGQEGPRRRRRRRGGRNRHRAGADTRDESGDEPAESAETSADDEVAGDEAGGDEAGGDDATATHRRRRRRRRGEDVDDAGDDDAEVVVKVREPRAAAKQPTDVMGIDGSTRLEAKKQRRREGRAASRRRAPILSEAEFLARREAVERQMLIRQRDDYAQIAVVEDGILVEHYVDRASATSLIGNIYLGKVQNVLPGMEAAFVDIGRVRNAVLYAGEVDWDSFGDKGQNRKIEEVFSPGQMVLVQVSKDPVGAKGARLTSHISIPGRYVVYAPQGHISGISRKLSDIERTRLKTILDGLVDQGASVVIRTAAEAAGEEELIRDVNRLKAQWEVISKKIAGKQSPQLLYAEPDLTLRIVRDLFTEDFSALVVDGNGGMEDAHETVGAYVQHIAPHLADRIQQWDRAERGDLFARYRIDEQIAKALDRRVHLPSGGSLVIDRTEAMTVIDVNTGKFTGSGGNLESTVTSNNLEAAEEIVRQLRLRDIGGIIIVDFIDMVLASNRELLLRRLVECLSRDRTRHQVSEVTSLGLVQLTRKKVGTGLAEAFTKTCELCNGEGHIRYDEPVDSQAPADGGERHGRAARRHN